MWTIQQIGEDQWQVQRDGQPVEGLEPFDLYEHAVAWLGARLGAELADEQPAPAEASGDGLLPETWVDDEGIFFSEPTGDGRDFSACEWSWRDPAAVPVPLMLQTCTDIGHFGAQLAGFATEISAADGTGHAAGRFYDSEVGRQFRDMLLGGRKFGVSVDPGSVDVDYDCLEFDDEGWCIDENMRFLAYQVIGITGTPFAGFERAKIKLGGAPAAVAASAGATDFGDLPLGERDQAWDVGAAESRVRVLCSSDGSGDAGTIDWEAYRAAFFWYDSETPEEFGSYKLGFADVADGALTAVWAGVAACASVMQGARGGVDIPEEDEDAVRAHIAAYYEKASTQYDDDEIVVPWEQQSALAAEDGEDGDAAEVEPTITDHEFADDEGDGFCTYCVLTNDEADGGECLQQCGAVEAMHGAPAEDEGGEPAPAEGEQQRALAAAAPALSIPLAPPRQWMELPEPQLGDQGGHDLYGAAVSELLVEQPGGGVAVPWQILDNGLVFGHIARWGQPHVGFPGQRVTAPDSETAYAHFHVGQVVCDDGTSVAAGTLVVGCEHAPLRGISPFEARDFYAHSGFGWANVRATNGQHGVWACGVLRPDVTAEQVRVLRSLAPSGDWRKIGRGLEMIGALMVSVPGFPVAREAVTASGLDVREAGRTAAAVSSSETTSLVAAGMVYRCAECAKRARELGAAQALDAGPEATARRLDAIERRLAGLDGHLGIIERRTRHLLAPGREDLRRRILGGNGHAPESADATN